MVGATMREEKGEKNRVRKEKECSLNFREMTAGIGNSPSLSLVR